MRCTKKKKPSEKSRLRRFEDNGEAKREISADVGTVVEGSAVAGENVEVCEMNASVTEVSTFLQASGIDGETKPVQGTGELNAEPEHTNTSSKRTPSRRQQRPRVEPGSGSERKCIAAELRKRNGVVAETGNLSSLPSAVEQNSQTPQSEKPGHAEEPMDSNGATEKSRGKHHRAPALNGFRGSPGSVTRRRRRSNLQVDSHSLNVVASELKTDDNGAAVDAVAAVLEELSDSRQLRLVNGKGVESTQE